MPQKKFIKNIDNIVAKQIKELEIKPKLKLDYFKKKDKRFFSSPSQTKNNETVFFKILISNEKQDKQLLRKEIATTNFLSGFSQKDKRLNIPLFIKSNASKFPYWFTRQYLPGKIIGHHFTIYKNGLLKEMREKTADNLLALQKITYKKYKKELVLAGLEQKSFGDYLLTIKNFENILKLKNKEKTVDLKKLREFLTNQKKYFHDKDRILSHGDATLANFFISSENVYLTDWELAKIDSPATDIARTWIQTFQYPKWRKELILYFLKNINKQKRENFKQMFRTIIAVEALSELACDTLVTSRENQKKKKARQAINLSIKGFNNLININ